MTTPFTSPQDVRKFVLGGNARFTIESVGTGVRFTYRVKASEPSMDSFGKATGKPGVFFVSLLSGPDNESDYQYMGIIPADDPMAFRHTSKSKVGTGATSSRAFVWFWKEINMGRLPATVRCWHEGSCGRCGRTLTVPESIASGFGPECIQHV